MIRFEVFGEPVPKARHRTARLKNGMMIQYQDKKARAQEDSFIVQALPFKPPEPMTGPISLTIEAYFSIPKSFSQKKKGWAILGDIFPTKKPDFDNLAKFIGDTLNKIFWEDDKQIIEAHVYKRYSHKPRWVIQVEEL